MTLRGRVEGGKIVLEEHVPLPEGAQVEVYVMKPRPVGPFQPDPDLMKYSGIIDDLPPDASQNIDRILYGGGPSE